MVTTHAPLHPPELMMTVTSSMVMAVSAMLVARTILCTPTGGRKKTRRWSAAGTMLCRGRMR